MDERAGAVNFFQKEIESICVVGVSFGSMKRNYEILGRTFNAGLLPGKSWQMNSALRLTLMKEAGAS
jgi:hypothetical protein